MKGITTILLLLLFTSCTNFDFVDDEANYDYGVKVEKIVIKKREAKKIVLVVRPNFEFDKALLSDTDKAEINGFIDLIRGLKGKLYIEGHTDYIGRDEYNKELSLKRAQAVYIYMAENLNMSDFEVFIYGKGESELLSDEKTLDANRLNRRVVLSFEEVLDN